MRKMEEALNWGLGVVRGVQTIMSPGLTAVMKGLSFLGTEWFFLLALPLIYWCVNRKRGVRLSLLFLASSFFNLWLKDIFAQPRPYELDPKVGLAKESSFGLPSGHAQGSVVFWGSAAPLFKRPWGLVFAIFFPLAVSFSRVYLGVHFPTDIFGGWLLGLLFLAFDYFLGDRIERLLGQTHPRLKVAGAAIIALAMNALDMRDTSLSGVFFGAAAGFAFVPTLAPFKNEGSLAQKTLRLFVGLAGAGLIYLGLKAAFPAQGSDLYALFRFVRYAVLGAWVSLGAPWVFLKLRLAEREAAAN
jgi:membrane-associated phospholipid phosphatase